MHPLAVFITLAVGLWILPWFFPPFRRMVRELTGGPIYKRALLGGGAFALFLAVILGTMTIVEGDHLGGTLRAMTAGFLVGALITALHDGVQRGLKALE